MSINAINVNEVTVNPTNIRYSLSIRFIGSQSGTLYLQRSEHREDGTWLDDPAVGSRKAIPLPTTDGMNAAIGGITSLLPAILAAIGITDSITTYRLHINGILSAGGVLDESIVIQMLINNSWQAKTIPSLTAFLTDNPALASSVIAAWDALDTEINIENATERWL